MPTYQYLCPLGHVFDKVQKMTDKPRAKCPTCGKMAVRQISGGVGLVFRGSGFYITDYGKDGKGPRKDTEKPVAAGSEGTDKAAKPETKPAAEKSETRAPKTESTSPKKKAAGE